MTHAEIDTIVREALANAKSNGYDMDAESDQVVAMDMCDYDQICEFIGYDEILASVRRIRQS